MGKCQSKPSTGWVPSHETFGQVAELSSSWIPGFAGELCGADGGAVTCIGENATGAARCVMFGAFLGDFLGQDDPLRPAIVYFWCLFLGSR